MVSRLITFILFSQNALILCGQDTISQHPEQYELHIHRAIDPITIDGELNEASWSSAAKAENFWQTQPVDGEPASHATIAYAAYDDKNLYIGAICYDDSDKHFIRTLKRDDWGVSDEFGILVDPMGQKAIAYGFGVNVLGGETEGIISAPDEADATWDNRWTSAVMRYEDRYTIEMAIPLKTLRFRSGENHWRIQLLRIDPDKNEVQCWAPVPRQFTMYDLGYFGSLIWDTPPAKQGNNVAIIPYIKSSLNKIHTTGSTTIIKGDFGGDAKIALTSSLNLDLTTNPDFSQVEVDQQVTNLTRFGIFFPERRQFFIENNDVFTDFGSDFGAEQPFYSRRIGLDKDGRTVPIIYGLRISGNVSPGMRIGAFNIHSQDSYTKEGQNYSAATFQQKIGKRSFINGLFLNCQAYLKTEPITDDFGRNAGLEVEHITEDGKWEFEFGGLTSIKKGFTSGNNHLYGSAGYSGQRFRTILEFQNMGDHYFSDMGFTGRLEQFDPVSNTIVGTGFSQLSNFTDYYTYPKNSKDIDYHWSGLENYVYLNTDGTINEWYTRLRHFFFYKNTSVLRFRINNNYVDLLYPFALTEVPLPAKAYNMTEFNIQYNSDSRRPISGELFGVYGQFFDGTILTARISAIFRRQPWGNFTLGVEQNNIYLPEPYGNLKLTLANARIELNFRKNLYWTTFLQYNTQANNFNFNSRIQWRFAPMSDVYLVYTDNYLVEPAFGPKDKTLVLKVNYWLSL